MSKGTIIFASNTRTTPFLTTIEDKLKQAGFAIDSVTTISDVITQLEQAKPMALFLDDSLPEEEILECLHHCQTTSDTHNLPIFLTALNVSTGEMNELLQAGAADVLEKSDPLSTSLGKIDEALGTALRPLDADIDITAESIPKTDKEISVLVVEDDALLKNLLETRLGQAGIERRFSTDGVGVVALAKEMKPSVIILDIMLPGINGLDVLAELHADKDCSTIPVIIFSNRDEQADRQLAKELGAKKYYVKAMTELSDLVKTIEELAA